MLGGRPGLGEAAENFGVLVPSVAAEDGTAAGIYDLRRLYTGRCGVHHGRGLLAPGHCPRREFPSAFRAVIAPGSPTMICTPKVGHKDKVDEKE